MMVELPAEVRIAGTVLLPDGRLGEAVLELRDARIAALERDPAPALRRALRRDGTRGFVLSSEEVLAPAFIDVHCHGAGGGDVLGEADGLGRMSATLWRHGVAAVVAAVATAPIPQLRAAARMLAQVIGADRPPSTGAEVLGLHLEGPALCPERSGGHDPDAFVSPAALSRWLVEDPEAWRTVRVVTLAPELEGGQELVSQLSRAGIAVSVGHTDASIEESLAAYAGGARSTTHLFNGMPPLLPRRPGPVGAALAAAPYVELITDGIHVDPRILAPIARAIGPERLMLVSDALPLAGSRLRSVRTPGSSARVVGDRVLHPDGTLAGSRLLLDGMVESAVRHGIPLPTALRAASANPAALLGLTERGHLGPGAVADLVAVSRRGRLRRVLRSAASA